MPAAPKPYYAAGGASTRFYDLVTAADPALRDDIDAYARIAGARRTVLELGAGTGRVAIALAARGFHVTGLDLAPAMLAQAGPVFGTDVPVPGFVNTAKPSEGKVEIGEFKVLPQSDPATERAGLSPKK